MALFDLPLDRLREYQPDVAEQADFDAFWQRTLAEQDARPIDATFTDVAHPAYDTVSVQDVAFTGFGGTRVRGWFVAPRQAQARLQCLVGYQGYGGGRSMPFDHLWVAAAGMAYLFMDTRGQGSVWSPGDTPDDHQETGNGPQVPGFMTRGIGSPDTYYYRRVFVDAVRAIRAAASHPRVDPARIGVTGISQGGGITLAAAALAGPDMVKVCMPDVPFLCHYQRAIELVDSNPYNEIVTYLKTHRDAEANVLRTLSYFDGVNFASRIRARTLVSVGLMDNICPPSTVFAAFNRVKGPKEIAVYKYNNHEGGGVVHQLRRAAFAKQWL
jgi:cephalosporin-C deacetylase